METVQIINITPDEFTDLILQGVKELLDLYKKDLLPKPPTEYLTRTEVKELLKVDLSTVHNWTKKGILKAYGIGARVYYKRNEIEVAMLPLNNI